MELQDLALKICREAHTGQVDKSGIAYHFHPERVAAHAANLARVLMPSLNSDAIVAVALLHDVLEDCPDWSAERLVESGIPAEVAGWVQALTVGRGERRSEYLERVVSAGPVTVLVKLADLTDNTDPARTAKLGQADRERLAAKYAPNIDRMRQALASEILKGI